MCVLSVFLAWSRRRWVAAAGGAAAALLLLGLPTAVVPNPLFGRSIPPTEWAVQFFAPVQPYLAVAGVGVLAWALWVRLRGEAMCALPALPPVDADQQSVAPGRQNSDGARPGDVPAHPRPPR